MNKTNSFASDNLGDSTSIAKGQKDSYSYNYSDSISSDYSNYYQGNSNSINSNSNNYNNNNYYHVNTQIEDLYQYPNLPRVSNQSQSQSFHSQGVLPSSNNYLYSYSENNLQNNLQNNNSKNNKKKKKTNQNKTNSENKPYVYNPPYNQKEIDDLRVKNEFYLQRGILLENRIWYDSLSVKIQSFFRGYLIRRKLEKVIFSCMKIKNAISILQRLVIKKRYNTLITIKKYDKNEVNNTAPNKLRSRHSNSQITNQVYNVINKLKAIENHFKNTDIDNNNRIVINLTKNENENTNTNNNKKEDKKEEKIEQKIEEKKEQKSDYSLNIQEWKIKKLRDLVRKKMSKNKEILHIVFMRYYYSSLYVHINWYLYVVNQLSCYTQGLTPIYDAGSNSFGNNNSLYETQPVYEDLTKSRNPEVKDALRQTLRQTIRNINTIQNKDEALRQSIMSINQINKALSNEAKEKEKEERQKRAKELFSKKLLEIKAHMHKLFTRFYYQGKLWEKAQNEANNKVTFADDKTLGTENTQSKLRRKKRNSVWERRNKARNLRKIMAKKEKEKLEKLRQYFYRFYTNGMISVLKKQSKKTLPIRDSLISMEGGSNGDVAGNMPTELTFMDKKLLEKKKERHELEQKRSEALKNIIYKNERHKLIILKNVFESWNLRAKIISLPKVDGLKKSVRKKKLKKSCRKKESKKKYRKHR